MILLGAEIGNYEGNNWGKIYISEPFRRPEGNIGAKVSALKMDYQACVDLLKHDDYIGKYVDLWFDRYGKVIEVSVQAVK